MMALSMTSTTTTRLAALMAATTTKAAAVSRMQARALSTQGTMAVQKLRSVLEEYRQANYSQELPTRFKKDLIKASHPDTTTNVIEMDGFKSVLRNIGVEDRFSPSEIKIIFKELGNDSGKIPVQQMVQII